MARLQNDAQNKSQCLSRSQVGPTKRLFFPFLNKEFKKNLVLSTVKIYFKVWSQFEF